MNYEMTLFILSTKRFNTPTVDCTIVSCSTNISEVISKQRKRDMAYKNYQNELNQSKITPGINPISLALVLQHRQLHEYSVHFYLFAVLCLSFYATLCIARRCISNIRSHPELTVNFVGSCGLTLIAIAFLCYTWYYFYSALPLLLFYL